MHAQACTVRAMLSCRLTSKLEHMAALYDFIAHETRASSEAKVRWSTWVSHM